MSHPLYHLWKRYFPVSVRCFTFKVHLYSISWCSWRELPAENGKEKSNLKGNKIYYIILRNSFLQNILLHMYECVCVCADMQKMEKGNTPSLQTSRIAQPCSRICFPEPETTYWAAWPFTKCLYRRATLSSTNSSSSKRPTTICGHFPNTEPASRPFSPRKRPERPCCWRTACTRNPACPPSTRPEGPSCTRTTRWSPTCWTGWKPADKVETRTIASVPIVGRSPRRCSALWRPNGD